MALNRIQRDGIEDSAIDTSKILDGILGTADITNDTLTNAKFSNSAAIPTSKLAGLATSATTDTTSATNITSGSLATARVNVGTTAGKILQVDGSGNLPAIDGSLLTGIVSFTKSASDPTISTNPSAGVGAEWVNTTSGEVYLCTDATAGENVWTNVGGGSGNIAPVPPAYQGSQYGYACGAYSASDVIDKFSYTSDGNASDVGNLTIARGISQGNSSSTYGHVSGGRGGSTYYNTIDRFPFASDTNASDWGDLTDVIAYGTGCSDVDYGYTVGGRNASIYVDVIQRFQFSSNAGASDVGDLTANRQAMTGHSDQGNSYGFVAGGETGPPWAELNIIERFAFASSSNSSDVGDLIAANSNQFRNWSIGPNSSSYGFTIGGNPNSINNIQRFAFASSANATDWADLTTGNYGQAGSSSGTNGYAAGGANTNTTIEKFPFASQTNATDIGNLSVNRGYTEGNQY